MFFNKLSVKNKIVAVVVAAFVLILSVVLIVVFSSGDKVDVNNNPVKSDVSSPADSGNRLLSGDSCFLVVCNDDKAGDIVFMFLADFRVYSSELILTPLSSDTVSADGRSYGEVYNYGGINLLRDSIAEVRNVEIDRYAILDRSGVSALTDLMGEVSLDVNEQFTYQSSDKSYEVEAGKTDMGSDMLFTYLKLCSQKYGADKFVMLIRDMINTYLEDIDVDDIEDTFAGLTNCFDTDVTISDYFSAVNDITYLVEHDMKCVLVNDVD